MNLKKGYFTITFLMQLIYLMPGLENMVITLQL
jgi:hypothetical protein